MEFNKYSISIKGLFNKKYLVFNGPHLFMKVQRKSIFTQTYLVTNGKSEILFSLSKRIFSFLKFELVKGNQIIGQITKDTFSNSYDMQVDNLEYKLKGNLFSSEYAVLRMDEEIAKVSRKKLSKTDRMGIVIESGHQDEYILAMLIVLEIIKQTQQNT